MSGARAVVDRAMTEAQWQRIVEECAAANGWTCWHDHDARRNDSGLPDLILIRDRVIWVELKRDGKQPTKVQRWFHDVLRGAGQEVYVWTPSMFAEVKAVLKGGG
jgi:hypothetical protein